MTSSASTAKDPVCGMSVNGASAASQSQYQGQTYFFCSVGCRKAFETDPAKYLGGGYKASMMGAMLGRIKGLFGGKQA